MPEKPLREKFLHYIWQFQYFNKENLKLSTGESLSVLSPGFLNNHSGPDFSGSRILFNNIEFHGTTEIHYKSSDWHKHRHTTDRSYNNVILHLVWINDKEIQRTDGTIIPCLELKDRVDSNLIHLYQTLLISKSQIPCAEYISGVEEIFKFSMLEKVLLERLEDKSREILQILSLNNGDWDQTCYEWLGKSFGFKINSDTFLRLCRVLPYKIVRKYQEPLQMEALLFGMAGFLSANPVSEYQSGLLKEFNYLKSKHNLDQELNTEEWKFLRLRPANFPTLRIAQLATFLKGVSNLADLIFNSSLKDISLAATAKTSPFWVNHYHFLRSSTSHNPVLGQESLNNILINAIIPLRFSYGFHSDDHNKMTESLELLKNLKPEKNHITAVYSDSMIPCESSFETQALIQLYNNYCLKRNCLSCKIGHRILFSNALEPKV